MDILTLLNYSFIQKAFLAGSLVAITCSLLGVFLVLKKMSLIGDGLSHISFGAISIGLFFGMYPFYFSVPIVIISSILILKLTQKTNLYGDAAIGIISSAGISLGIIFASLSKGFSVDIFSYLFGNILSISTQEVFISIILSLIVFIGIYFYYWDLFAITFDEEYAKTIGIKTNNVNYILAILTAISISLSIKIVGVMLVSSLLVLPAVTALQLSKKFSVTLFLSSIIALISVIFGILLSFIFDLPSGATIIVVNTIIFLLSLFYKKVF